MVCKHVILSTHFLIMGKSRGVEEGEQFPFSTFAKFLGNKIFVDKIFLLHTKCFFKMLFV